MNVREIMLKALKDVNTISKEREYNKYIKKYPIEVMFMFLLCYHYTGIKYGRAFALYLKRMIGDKTDTLSQSELSKKLCYKLPLEIFKEMYINLLQQAKGIPSKEVKRLKKMIRIIDSTSLSATSSMKYAKHRRNKNGFKMHTVIDGDYLPESIQLKNGCSSDKKSLKWAIKTGFIHIFDRAYNDYSQFRWISDKDAFFVTRALGNINFTIVKKRKVGKRQKEYGIISDKYIEVIEDRKTESTYIMRMITFEFIDSNGEQQNFSLLTNIFDLRSDEIARLYRERWNIEVIFRWIKMFLNIDHWLSRSKNGVLIQIYSALCAYLMALIARKNNTKRYRIMKDSIYEYIGVIKNFMCEYKSGFNIENLYCESG